ncbi:hypothetical protein HZC08_00740 [Candidatus Micrarchaeota archaeon]|nr:hypothetical protein [Candidatus Micrarchaeota archaeon]
MPLISVNYADFAKLVSPDEEATLREAMSLCREDGTLKDLFEMRFLNPILTKPYARLAYSKNCACEGFYADAELRRKVVSEIMNGVQAVDLNGRFKGNGFIPLERLKRRAIR